jgi:hypothetical protein
MNDSLFALKRTDYLGVWVCRVEGNISGKSNMGLFRQKTLALIHSFQNRGIN